MNAGEAKLPKLESERFEFTESLNAGVYVGLFPETVESTFSVKFHGYPVVSCVMRWLFIASATYIIHLNFFSCRAFRGQANACRTRQKSNVLAEEKRRCDFSSAGLTLMLQTTQYSQSQLIKNNVFLLSNITLK